VLRQTAEADNVTREGKLDDVVVSVLPVHVVAYGAALNAIRLEAAFPFVEQDVALRQDTLRDSIRHDAIVRRSSPSGRLTARNTNTFLPGHGEHGTLYSVQHTWQIGSALASIKPKLAEEAAA
jgi:hypothetical protein